MPLDKTKIPTELMAIRDDKEFCNRLASWLIENRLGRSQNSTRLFIDLYMAGGYIAGDGFHSLYNQIFSFSDWKSVDEILRSIDLTELADLLREARDIYYKPHLESGDRIPDDPQIIKWHHLDASPELGERFDEIGERVVELIRLSDTEIREKLGRYAREYLVGA